MAIESFDTDKKKATELALYALTATHLDQEANKLEGAAGLVYTVRNSSRERHS